MLNAQEQKAYRTKLFTDVFSGIIPDRVPVWDGLNIEYLIQYAGLDLMTTQYQITADLLLEIYEKGMEICRGDMPTGNFARNPIALMFQQSQIMEMGTSGFIQHPNVHSCRKMNMMNLFKILSISILENVIPA